MTDKTLIGRAEPVTFEGLGLTKVAARIDTGAKRSSFSATSIKELNGAKLQVTFAHPHMDSAITHIFDSFERINVASSNGHIEERYMVRLVVELEGRKVKARFTLTDRSTQVYPVLIGRNVLRGKFIVDVDSGVTLESAEKRRTEALQSTITKETKS